MSEYPKVVPSDMTKEEEDAAVEAFVAVYGSSLDEQYAATGMVAEDLRVRIIWGPLDEEGKEES